MSLLTSPCRCFFLATVLLPPIPVARGQATAPASRTGPAIPGAVVKPPAWLPPGTPFDVARFLDPPPAARDATPLYLDAMFEFSGDLSACFPRDSANCGRAQAAIERSRRLAPHLEALAQGRPLDARVADASIAEYAEGFRKLLDAQKRDLCSFATGVGGDAILPHVSASWQIVQAYVVKTARDLERGKIDDAIGNLAVCLRLARDLRPRGLLPVQFAANKIEWDCSRGMVPRILSARGLKSEHCDRIVRLLSEHEAGPVDPYAEAAKSETLSMFAGALELRTRFDKFRQELGLAADATPADALVAMGASLDNRQKEAVAARVRAWTPGDDATLAAAVHALCKGRLAQASPIYAARIAALEKSRAAGPNDDEPIRLIVETFDAPAAGLLASTARSTAAIRAARCLAAVRRWQLAKGKPPGDLATICRSAGLKAVPIDPFDGKPLRGAVQGKEMIIYSVGKDLRDDGGKTDSDLDRKPGDLTFRLDPPALR